MDLRAVAVAVVAVVGASSAAAASNCTLTSGSTIGSSKAFAHYNDVTQSFCCEACWKSSECAGYNLEPGRLGLWQCYLQADIAFQKMEPGSMHAVVRPPAPPPPPPTNAHVAVGTVYWRTLPEFKSWNIDASDNRGWEARNLSHDAPEGNRLWKLARNSVPGILRFGGSGNDHLGYFPCQNSRGRCMNETWFDNLMEFGAYANTKFVFGLDMGPRNGSRWDPTGARRVMQRAIERNFTFYGFELGNEENPGHDAESEALDFQILHKLLVEMYPDLATRPKIMGPDPHGFHDDNSTRATMALDFLRDFVTNTTKLGVPVAAITHHEYIEVDMYSTVPPTADKLDLTAQIAAAVNATLAPLLPPGVGIWAGEIGPHNGKTVPCDLARPFRWANFADIFWYLDAMGSKAANGYSAFCRQDFVGIDYGLVDCLTYEPLPDYWAGVLWGRLVGPAVVRTTSNDTSGVRAYTHCTVDAPNDATVVLLNLDPTINPVTNGTNAARNVTIAVGGQVWSGARTEYHLTGPRGTNSTAIALGGVPIALTASGDLPPLDGTATGGEAVIEMAAASAVFVVLHGAGPALECT